MDGEDMTVKARMLKLLEQHENELISGEAAAAELAAADAAEDIVYLLIFSY